MVTEAPPVAPLVETPVEVVAPVTEAPPVESAGAAPPIAEVAPPSPLLPPLAPSPERMRQQLEEMQQQRAQELRAREQQVRTQEDTQNLQAYTAQLATQIEQDYGLAPEQAAKLAEQQARVVYQSYQQQRAALQATQEGQAKVQVATIISQQHGVPIATLMQYNSPQEMQAVAERTKSESAVQSELAQLRAQVAKLTKGSVPAQNFSTGAVGAGSAGLNEQALEKAVASGQVAMTPEISARLNKYWAQ